MKFNHKCECNGCCKSANKRVKNGHWVCDDCYKMLMRNHRKFGHNVFFKEIHVGSIGLDKKFPIYVDVPVKYI